MLETGFGEVWVEGEISNCRVWNTGHVYFTLKDGDAQIKAVMFRSAVRYLKFKPEDGMHVIVARPAERLRPKGEYQIVCEHLEPHGLGALQLAFEQLKKKLQAEGCSSASRKRPLPALPRKIGIVTSLDGAALRDIIKVLRRRHPNAHLVIRPTRVQGEGAAADIAEALRAIVQVHGVDVVIVGRGGGSLEDLQAFNEEPVARAIAASPVPVVSAVGHEVDVTIADFVADLRAPTPSAAAELVVTAKDEFCARVVASGSSGSARRPRGRRAAAASRRAHAEQPTWSCRLAHPPRDARPTRGGADLSAATECGGAASADASARFAPCGCGSKRATSGATSSAIRSRLTAATAVASALRRTASGTGRTRAWHRSPAGSKTSARLACLRAATRSAGMSTGRAIIRRRGVGQLQAIACTGDAAAKANSTARFALRMSMDPTIKDFESAIAELETIVKRLEDGDLALEKSLELFERGVQLSRFCHSKLEEAERRVEILTERGEVKPAPPSLGLRPANPIDPGDLAPDGVARVARGPAPGRRASARAVSARARFHLFHTRLPPGVAAGAGPRRRVHALQRVRGRQAPAVRCSPSPSAEAVAERLGAPGASAEGLAMPAACALEMIHTYSLVHDDLPAMDNDTMRRGRPTAHVVFGEGLAILAGDALLTEAFALLVARARRLGSGCPADELNRRKLQTAAVVADAAGAAGMVGGQAIDLDAARPGQQPLDAAGLREMHMRKTGALIVASALSGAIMAGATEALAEAIGRYGVEIGLAFQIVDDILDVEGASAELGQDRRQGCGRRQADVSGALRPRRPRGGLRPTASMRAIDALRARGPRRAAAGDRPLGRRPNPLKNAVRLDTLARRPRARRLARTGARADPRRQVRVNGQPGHQSGDARGSPMQT